MKNTITINDLYKTLRKSWSKETAYRADKERWSEGNPACGQCAITALIVQDLFKGDIIAGKCGGILHYWNVVNGRKIDLTKEQFNEEINFNSEEVINREDLLCSGDVKKRYEMLKENLRNHGFNI